MPDCDIAIAMQSDRKIPLTMTPENDAPSLSRGPDWNTSRVNILSIRLFLLPEKELSKINPYSPDSRHASAVSL